MSLPLPSPPRWMMMARRSAWSRGSGGAADQRRIHHSVPLENLSKRTRADQAEAVTADRAPHTD